jgi:hypothetical protein
MDWNKIISEILARGYTLREVAERCGFASPGALHDLKSGKQFTVSYERGVSLITMHRRTRRRAS